MSDDLISKQAALDCFHAWIDKHGDVHEPDEIPEYRAIERLPYFVLPEIIMCENCLHWKENIVLVHQCEVHEWASEGCDFCSFAERREDEKASS